MDLKLYKIVVYKPVFKMLIIYRISYPDPPDGERITAIMRSPITHRHAQFKPGLFTDL